MALSEYTTVPLPEARDQESLERLLHNFATTPLPAFVIRQAGVSANDAREYLESLAPRSITFGNITYPFFTNYSDRRNSDLGLHVDLSSTTHKTTTINLHYTSEGSVRASFFLPGHRVLTGHEIPTAVKESFKEGRTDTDYTGVACHTAIIGTCDAVLFKESMPLVHDFTSIEIPRNSTAHLGSLAVPDLMYRSPWARLTRKK